MRPAEEVLKSQQESNPEREIVNEPTVPNVESVAQPVSVQNQEQLPPLPHGWEERQHANGRTYYVNHTARSTQWERPSFSDGGTYNDQVHECSLESATTEFQRQFHISVDDIEANRRESNSTIHQASNITDSTAQSQHGAETPSPPESQVPDSLDANSEGLPHGWTMQVAPNGRVFFIDHNERATTWVDPRTGLASPMPNQTHPRNRWPEDKLGTLPEG
jgi:E3 ubiquitin-protein ligase NEDD4